MDMPGDRRLRQSRRRTALEMFPLLNLVGNTLCVAAISYAGRLHVMAFGDAETYPDHDVFAAGFRHEFDCPRHG